MEPVQPDHPHGPRALAEEILSGKIGRRELLQRASTLGVSVTSAAALLAACGSSSGTATTATEKSSKGGTLVFGPYPDGKSYDPATNNSDGPAPPFPTIYEGLTAYDPRQPPGSPPQNLLAESIEKSADGKAYAFTLKQGVEFHHGFGELTAADVKYSFERNAGITPLYRGAPKGATSFYAADMPGLQEVKVTGKYAGVIKFTKPFVPFETLTLPWGTSGYIFPQKAVEKYGAAWPRHPVGTGAYEVVSYTPDSEMNLQRFANYSGANVKLGARNWFDEIKMLLVSLNTLPRGEALTVALQSGESDFTPNLGALDVKRLSANSSLRTYTPAEPFDYSFVALDVQNPKLKDVRVRQAIRYALNIPEIIAANLLPPSSRLNSIIAKEMGVGYWPGAPVYSRNVEKAKELLAAAGARNLTLELATPQLSLQPGEPNSVMQVIQANLADVGIKVDIIETAPNSWVAKAGFGQLMWNEYGGAPDPYYQFEWFTCSQIGVWNYASWCDKNFTALQADLATTSDVATRHAISVKMQELMDQAVPYVWISHVIAYAASKAKVMAVFDQNADPLMHYFYTV